MREDLLALGVASLSKAGEDEFWFAGHFGAAIISGHFLLNDLGLPEPVAALVEAKLDEMVETFPAFYPAPGRTAGDGAGTHAAAILEPLESAVKRVANSGHAVIYGSLALRALQRAPDLQTREHCQKIAALVRAASQHDPRRYYGFDDPSAVQVPCDFYPGARDVDGLTRAAVAECAVVYPDEEIGGQRRFFNGEKIHGVTHAQALADILALGHREIAQDGLDALRKQLYLSRQTPPDTTRTSPRSELIPTQAEFWRSKPKDGLHVVKLSYAALASADRLGEPRAELLSALGRVWNLG